MPLTNDEWLERYDAHITKLTGQPATRAKDEDPLVWLELGFMEDPEGAAEQEVQMRSTQQARMEQPTIYERMPMLQGYAGRTLCLDGPGADLPRSAAYLPDQALCSDKRRY